jgi:hypothetical protein
MLATSSTNASIRLASAYTKLIRLILVRSFTAEHGGYNPSTRCAYFTSERWEQRIHRLNSPACCAQVPRRVQARQFFAFEVGALGRCGKMPADTCVEKCEVGAFLSVTSSIPICVRGEPTSVHECLNYIENSQAFTPRMPLSRECHAGLALDRHSREPCP